MCAPSCQPILKQTNLHNTCSVLPCFMTVARLPCHILVPQIYQLGRQALSLQLSSRLMGNFVHVGMSTTAQSIFMFHTIAGADAGQRLEGSCNVGERGGGGIPI